MLVRNAASGLVGLALLSADASAQLASTPVALAGAPGALGTGAGVTFDGVVAEAGIETFCLAGPP